MQATFTRTRIVSDLATSASSLGFEPISRLGRLVRQGSQGQHLFQVTVTENKDKSLTVLPHLGIRIDEVERIFHRFSGSPSETQDDSPTIGSSVDALFGEVSDAKAVVFSESGLIEASESMYRALMNYGLDYFNEFGSLAAIDRVINADSSRPSRHRAAPWPWCATGSIVARLASRPNFIEVVEIYRRKLRTLNGGFYLDRFERLLEALPR